MADEYKNFFRDSAPPWLQGDRGAELLETQGELADRVVAGAKEAVKAGFVESAPEDALPYLGSARLLERYPSDTDTGWRARIRAACDTWTFAGTEATVLAQLGLYLTTATLRVLENRDWTPPDGDTTWWSRFWVVIEGGPWSADGTWGDAGTWGPLGDSGTWDSDATPAEVATVRKILRKFKPAHTLGYALVLLGEGDFWGPDEPWDSGLWDDTATMIWAAQ